MFNLKNLFFVNMYLLYCYYAFIDYCIVILTNKLPNIKKSNIGGSIVECRGSIVGGSIVGGSIVRGSIVAHP